jgi:hypothetical protein
MIALTCEWSFDHQIWSSHDHSPRNGVSKGNQHPPRQQIRALTIK